MTALQVRQPDEGETAALFASVDAAFGSLPDLGNTDREAMAPPANRLAVFDDGRIVGGCLRYDSRLSLPGGSWVPAGALSGVGVEPGAQGRGALRELMRAHLDQCRERGEAASVLIASQTPIYGRFGYGCASWTAHWEADATAADLLAEAPTAGRVRLEHGRGEDVIAALEETWSAAGAARAGCLARSGAWWNAVLGPRQSWLGGGKQLLAVHESGAGYVLFTEDIAHGRQGLAEADISIGELIAADVAVELDLWRFVAALPWARRIKWHFAPVDPAPLFWLRDVRQLRRMSHFDMYWVRPLDVAALVAARSFAVDAAVRIQVDDPLYPDLTGCFDLRAESGAGTWTAARGEPELRLAVADLGALWLGGATARQLLAVGRIGGDAGAALRLDALLATPGPPRSIARF